MALTRYDLEVYYEDGREDVVVSDQRDQVMLERRFKIGFFNALDDMPVQAWRFLAWAALRRTGKVTELTFEDWDKTVIEATSPDEPEQVDPTQPGASATA